MSELEKINIYVPAEIGKQLHNDALLFEVYKKDKRTVNFNRFLSMLLRGYFDLYAEENKKTYDILLEKMSQTTLNEREKTELANRILKEVILPEIPRQKGAKPTRLSLKPTVDTAPLICSITSGSMAGDDSISQYFCRMLMAYCKKPISEREQIVFRENYLLLQDACRKGQIINFMTIWNNQDVRHVVPYCLAIGEEEMFNYLLCEEVNPKTGKPQPATYRLNRITKLTRGIETKIVTDEVKKYCDRMKEFAPQYVIKNDEEICVKLSPRGELQYNRIYHGRPKYYRIVKNDNDSFYYFKCSTNQVLLYFRRFEPDSAEIISPPHIRLSMIDHYRKSIALYTTDKHD